MNQLIYDQWHFSRPALTTHYLQLLLEGTGDPLALQSPRRWGKTTFLLSEIKPEAEARGLLPVYIDVWQSRDNPLSAINYGLSEALDDVHVPGSTVGRRLKTKVSKVSFAGAGVELGEEPSRKTPADPYLITDWLLKSLIRAAGRPVLLLIDEVQELAVAKDGEAVISALRSAITKSKPSVRVIFTGSNQDRLRELFSRSRAALYEGASLLNFPHLEADFLRFVAGHVKDRLHRKVTLPELQEAFERFAYQPRLLIDLVLLYASSNAKSFAGLLDDRTERAFTDETFKPLYDGLTPLQRAIIGRLLAQAEISSQEARELYAKALDRPSISPGSVSDALKSLIDAQVLTKPAGSGGYAVADALFERWLKKLPNGGAGPPA
jgi:hypothetical protein